MSNNIQSLILSSALAGLLVGVNACSGSKPVTPEPVVAPAPVDAAPAPAPEPAPVDVQPVAAPTHECKGLNECKGQGGCKVDGANACKGQNECKGKGGCKTSG